MLVFILAALCFASHPRTIHAQELYFTYAAPTDTLEKYFDEVDIYSIIIPDGQGDSVLVMPGYRFVRLQPEHAATVRSIAPPNMRRTYDSLMTNSEVRMRVDSLMQVSGGIVSVEMYLVDDRNGLIQDEWYVGTSVDDNAGDGTRMIWPAASNWRCHGDKYCGDISLGERSANEIRGSAGGWLAWEATLLHEISHTQFLPDPKKGGNKWGSISIAYGGDEGHWLSELQGDQQAALDEGLASFWGAHHNYAEANHLIAFHEKMSPRYLLGSWSFLSGTKEMWDAPHKVVYEGPIEDIDTAPFPIHLRESLAKRSNGKGHYALREYKWLDVPGFYILFNEQTSTAFFYLFWNYSVFDPDISYSMVVDVAKAMAGSDKLNKRHLTYAVNRLALSMEEYATTRFGQRDLKEGELVSSMYPFALLDILTHFGMSEEKYKREYKIMYPDRHPKAYEAYWNHREEIKKVAFKHIKPDSMDMLETVEAVVAYLQKPEAQLIK